MAVSKLPLDSKDKNFNIRFVIANRPYNFRFYFNTRDTYWYCDINDDNNDPIKSGMKVVNGIILLQRLITSDRPPGDFVFVPKDFTNEDPQEDNLGTAVDLLFYESADITAVAS